MKIANRKFWLSVVLVGSVTTSLTACFPLVVGGAAMSGLVALDRRSSGTYLNDETIELRAASRIRDTLGERGHVNITSYNMQVLITGEMPNDQDKQLVEQTVRKVDNVKGVVNEIEIMSNTSFTQRSNDALITGRVKAGMVDAKDIVANAFKVVTERGVTYLMGRVTQREATRATDITRSTPGVQKVVRVFEIITEDELQGLKPAEAPKN